MVSFGERLKELRKKHNITQGKLAKILNVKNTTISNYEAGRSYPDFDTLTKIADYFGVSVDYLIGRIDTEYPIIEKVDVVEEDKEYGIPDTEIEKLRDSFQKALIEFIQNSDITNVIIPKGYKKVPIVGRIRAGEPILAEENIEGYTIVDEEDVRGGDYFFLRVEGDSMINARIMDGDYVFVRRQPDVENGEIAVVRINGEEATVKRVHKVNDNIILEPANPKYKPIVFTKKDLQEGKLEIIGKVVYIKAFPK